MKYKTYKEFTKESVNEGKGGRITKFPKTIKVIKKIWLDYDVVPNQWKVSLGHEAAPPSIFPGTKLTFRETGPGYGIYYDVDDDSYPEFTFGDLERLKKDRAIKI